MTPIDRYTCEEVLRRLDDYIDRELSPGEMQLVREHLETCAVCAQEHTFATETLETLKEKLRRIDVPRDLMTHVSQRLSEARAVDEAQSTG
jgi:anti-sigma factor (TIGR02949 family)